MKVKVGELKTHLSKYLRELERSDEPIEVCVREETVAYLTSAKAEGGRNPDVAKLDRRLNSVGITVYQWGASPLPLRSPGRCKKPAGEPNSVETLRGERPY